VKAPGADMTSRNDKDSTFQKSRETTAIEWTLEGSQGWLRSFAFARIGVLVFITLGTIFLSLGRSELYLYLFYAFAFATNYIYLYTLKHLSKVSSPLTWAQVLVDFSIVALVVSRTEAPASFFSFIFVVVVLEAGILLGFAQGVIVATLAMAFMFLQTLFPPLDLQYSNTYTLWYNYAVQAMLFYLTAFISGYWNSRLHRMREFQNEILDNLNNGFIITNADGHIIIKNNAAEVILGITESSIGKPIEEVMQPLSGEECPVNIALRIKQDYTSYEFRIQHPERGSVMLGLTTNLLVSSEGELSGIIVSFTDLTEINAIRQELRRHDRMAVIGELAAGLAHEIRNPVAIIRGAVDEMSTSADSPEIINRLKVMALRESDHLNDIVSGFLNFASNPSTEQTPVELSHVIFEVLELLKREYQDESMLVIESLGLDREYWVSGDASQLKQVFVNIGKNAIEAMECTGRLVISIHQGTFGPISLDFSDTGPGIEPEHSEKIFEPFFTQKNSGVGMGLAVCMRIITAHNGTIRASNRKGGGCSMNIQIPPLHSVHKEEVNEQ
jgi:two-component system, NtrC family, sensor histidine kinase PilS